MLHSIYAIKNIIFLPNILVTMKLIIVFLVFVTGQKLFHRKPRDLIAQNRLANNRRQHMFYRQSLQNDFTTSIENQIGEWMVSQKNYPKIAKSLLKALVLKNRFLGKNNQHRRLKLFLQHNRI